MSRGLEVRTLGHDRACIVGARPESAETRAFAAWLGARPDVVKFEQRPETGAFYVEFDDGAHLPGRFVRALREAIPSFTPRRTAEFGVAPVHVLPGRIRVKVTGIGDDELETLAVRALSIPGVTRTEHLPSSDTLLLFYDPQRSTEAALLEALRRTSPEECAARPEVELRWFAALGATSVLVTCIAGTLPFPAMALGVVLSTYSPLRRSLEALADGKLSVDLLDVAATFAALATRRPVTAAFVIWMVAVGDLLLDVSANNARTALSTVMHRKERWAERLSADGRVESVPARELAVGDRLVVHTGRGVIADGTILSGTAEVDEKAISGESRLLSKRAGDRVFASSVVVEGQLVIGVESSGRDTEAAKIERILRTVGTKPLTLQRDSLELASKLVLPTFGVAALAAALSGEVSRAVCVLITDFGTGIRIAVPTSALTAMTLAAREGVLFKGAQYLERLSKADTIVFDKTGTLTNGVPEVVLVVTSPGIKAAWLIRLAASAEANHDHPVARALKAYARERGIPLAAPDPGSEAYVVGRGLSARVAGHHVRVGRATWMTSQKLKTSRFRRRIARLEASRISNLLVAVDGKVLGLIGYSDGTRPESAAIVRRLSAGGARTVMLLSGDNRTVVRNVAREVGIDVAVGALFPHQKADYIRRLRDAGHVVAMVGDGINDAPALACADVGISIAGSTDVAIETADVILLEGGLGRLEKAFAISDQAMRAVRQNLGVVIAPNAIAIALGAFGLIQPPMAAIINNGATALAVLAGTLPLLHSHVELPGGPSTAGATREPDDQDAEAAE